MTAWLGEPGGARETVLREIRGTADDEAAQEVEQIRTMSVEVAGGERVG